MTQPDFLGRTSVAWDGQTMSPAEALRVAFAAIQATSAQLQPLQLILRPNTAAIMQGMIDLDNAFALATTTPVASAILKRWSSRPWQPEHALVLADALEEAGHPVEARALRSWQMPEYLRDLPTHKPPKHRGVRRALTRWRNYLRILRMTCSFSRADVRCETDWETRDIPF